MRQPVRVVLADDHDAFVEGLGMVLSAEGDLEIVALAGDGASALQAVLTHRPDVLVVDTQMPGPAVTELVRLVGQAEPATRVLLLAEDARLEPSSQAGPAGMTRAVSARELAQAIRAVAAGFRVVAADPPAPHGSPNPRHIGAPEREGSRRPEGARAAVHTPGTGAEHAPGTAAVHAPGTAAVHGPGTAAVHGPGTAAVHGPGTAAVHGPGTAAVHSPERPERDHHAELLLRSLSERERQILGLLARGYSNRRIAEACFLSLNTVRTHVQNVLVKLGVHSKLEAAALAVREGWCASRTTPPRRPAPRAWRSSSVGAGRPDRRKFLKAGAGGLLGAAPAWWLWPGRRSGGPLVTPARPGAPAGAAAGRAGTGRRGAHRPGPHLAGPALLGQLLWGAGTAEEQAFEGTVAADPPGDGEPRVGLPDCAIHS